MTPPRRMTPPRMTEADVGGYYVKEDGTVWMLVGYADRPTATLERMEKLDDVPGEVRTPCRTSGVVGSLIFEGFRKLVPEAR